MKSKLLSSCLIIAALVSIFIIVLTNTCSAEEGNYIISIKNKSSKFIKTLEKGGLTYFYYDISITLHNSGDVQSDSITIKLGDEDGNLTSKEEIIIKPGEDKTYTFSNHILVGKGEHTLHISYYPTDINKRNIDNSGSSVITVKYTDSDNNNKTIPGFELIFLLAGTLTVILFKKRKNIWI